MCRFPWKERKQRKKNEIIHPLTFSPNRGLNYIIDVYTVHANSAIASNTLVRALSGAGFPLFATAMYHTLGTDWATSLLAFLCVALIPVPICFFVYGKRLRALSSFVDGA